MRLLKFFLFLFLSIAFRSALAQDTLRGQVLDGDRQPIMAAHVYWCAFPQKGAYTDPQGRFQLRLPDTPEEPDSLQVSAMGFGESRLLIDARVRPSDIDTVYPGMTARVILSAFTQRNLPRLYGTVDVVAADRLLDERTGEPYFLVKIAVREEDILALGNDIELTSGMSADVMLLTGDRTLGEYLLKSFADSLRQSFRES